MATNDAAKARMIGINHVALEVDDIDQALAFYRSLFQFELRARNDTHAFIDLGDQYLAFFKGRTQARDHHRHFGLVVDDRSVLADRVEAAGGTLIQGPDLDFLDPWGNYIQVIAYDEVQFLKNPGALEKLGAGHLKNQQKPRSDF